jgi:polygalacturonase
VDLTASGVIDGNGENNPNWNGPEATRPMAIFVALSKNVTIQDVQVVNSGMWSVVNFENYNVLVQYVRVDSHSGPTRDGIDIVDSTKVLVDHCDVNSEDDSICLKSGSAKGLHDVTVQNSHLRNSGVANALKIGTASVGPIDGILFQNIQVDSVKQTAMAVESVDGSAINGVTYKNIKFNNAGTAFFVLLGLRTNSPKVGSIQNISFEDITGSVNLNWGSALSGSVINGQTYGGTYKISNISFQNVNVTENSNQGLTSVPASPPEYAGDYPDPRMPGWHPLPAFGLYVRHADGVSLTNTRFTVAPAAKGDARPPINTKDDVAGINGQ